MRTIAMTVTGAARIDVADIRAAHWDDSDLVYDTIRRSPRGRQGRVTIRLTEASVVSTRDFVPGQGRPASWDELGTDPSTGSRFRGGGRWAFSGPWLPLDSDRVGFRQEFSDNPERMIYAASFVVICTGLLVSTSAWFPGFPAPR